MKAQIEIPKPFLVKPFFVGDATFDINEESHFWAKKPDKMPFYDDLLHSMNLKIALEEPWLQPKLAVGVLLERWERMALPQLEYFYKDRNRQKARPLMIQYTSHYIQAMYLIDGKPVPSLLNIVDHIKNLTFAPVNIADRLSFILSSIDHHHSYVTLTQLFNESKKKWAIYLN